MIYTGVGQVKEPARDGNTLGTSNGETNNSKIPLSTLGLKGARSGESLPKPSKNSSCGEGPHYRI